MQEQSNIFIKTASRIKSVEHFDKILQNQEIKIQFKAFNIDKIAPNKAMSLYKQIVGKYKNMPNDQSSKDSWHENQKKLFVWFIVFYTYFIDKQSSKNGQQADKKPQIDFEEVSKIFINKKPLFIEFHYYNLLKMAKSQWTGQEDRLLEQTTKEFPYGRWSEISMSIFQKTDKKVYISSKLCRERWLNHLDKNKIKGNWTLEEDIIVLQNVLHVFGKKWSKLKAPLQDKRTEHMIKNRFKSLIKLNRIAINERDVKIGERILEQFRVQLHNRGSFSQRNQDQQSEEEDASLDMIKEENHSEENHFLLRKSAVKHDNHSIKEGENQEKLKRHRNELIQSKVASRVQEHNEIEQKIVEEDNNIYPFSQYNYEMEVSNNPYDGQMFNYYQNSMLVYPYMHCINHLHEEPQRFDQIYPTIDKMFPTSFTYDVQPQGNQINADDNGNLIKIQEKQR